MIVTYLIIEDQFLRSEFPVLPSVGDVITLPGNTIRRVKAIRWSCHWSNGFTPEILLERL